jgi:hypothetical protein
MLGGSQFPVFEYSRSPENLREPRKFAAIVVQRAQSRGAIHRALGERTMDFTTKDTKSTKREKSEDEISRKERKGRKKWIYKGRV